jgi:hypothetical protein
VLDEREAEHGEYLIRTPGDGWLTAPREPGVVGGGLKRVKHTHAWTTELTMMICPG